MNSDIQARIAAIKAECEEILRLSEKAQPAPWHAEITSANDFVMAGRKYVCALATLSGREHDFRFIAHARNVSPAIARVVMATINRWEALAPAWSSGSGLCAQLALEEIANQWEGK